MDYVRKSLTREKEKVDKLLKDTVSDLYFYSELEMYLNPVERKKKTDFLKRKADELKGYFEEVEFMLDLMDQAGIDEIFKKFRRNTFKTSQNKGLPKIEEKGEVI